MFVCAVICLGQPPGVSYLHCGVGFAASYLAGAMHGRPVPDCVLLSVD